uniref:EGF-like domain-containing protein n=1 Tax=Angiostrongylus cantonensis TaxID=6313 RepID=A0A0K0DBQ6_ANGCA
MVGFLCEGYINECLLLPSENGATCFNRIGSYYCMCFGVFRGASCQERLEGAYSAFTTDLNATLKHLSERGLVSDCDSYKDDCFFTTRASFAFCPSSPYRSRAFRNAICDEACSFVVPDRTNSTCWHLAAPACASDVMAALLGFEEMREEVDAVDDNNRTALMLVAVHGGVDAKAALMLIDAGANGNCGGDSVSQ